jgi:uncharacterized protein (TIGR03437 family)
VILSTPTGAPAYVFTSTFTDTGPLIALNDVRQTTSGSISVTSPENFGADKRTRIMFYAVGLSNLAANTDPGNDLCVDGVVVPNRAESVIVEARTQDGRVYYLPVEFAGTALIAGLDQVEVVLIPELQSAGVVDLTIIVNDQRSNSPTIMVN